MRAQISQLEYEIFVSFEFLLEINQTLLEKLQKAISYLDVLSGLAELAATNNYIQPEMVDNQDKFNSRKLSIKDGRHPVVEQILTEKIFVPNDIELGSKTDLIILSGPNASGKSCYLRQVGLLQIMAQIGSWIPA